MCASSCGQRTAGGEREQSNWHSAKREKVWHHWTATTVLYTVFVSATRNQLCFPAFSILLHFVFLLSPAHPANSPLALSPFPLSPFWCVCLHGFWALSNSIWPQQRRRCNEKNHFHMCKLGTPPPQPHRYTQTDTSCTFPPTHWLPRLVMVIKGTVCVGPRSESISCHDCNVTSTTVTCGKWW